VSSREYVFPFGSRLLSWPPLPCLSDKRAPTVSSVPHLQPPELAHVATASRPLSAAQPAPRVPPSRYHLAFISPPLIPLLKPPLPSMALKPLTPALTPPATPPQRSPDPYKRTAPLPASLLFSPRLSLPLTERRRLRFCTAVARPPRRRLSPGEALAELPVGSSLYCAPAGERATTPRPPPLSTPPSVHGGPSAPGRSMDAWTRSMILSVEKQIPSRNSPPLCKEAPMFL
jgi:hypothetical protein